MPSSRTRWWPSWSPAASPGGGPWSRRTRSSSACCCATWCCNGSGWGRTGARPATREELYAALEKRSEAPLARMIQDYFVQGYLPEPILDGVELHHAAGAEGGWRVTGRLRNRSQGEALCKVVLTTDRGRLETTARTDGGQAGDFSFSTPHRPQAVLLDPDRECHRLIPNAGARDRVFFAGGAS